MESHGLLVLGNCGRKKTRTAGEIERMIKSVVPAILAKMPKARLRRGINLQQDNAGPHRAMTSELIKASVDLGPYSILVKNQPPNSPDFNVLDLGFFNSIQSLQYQKATRTIEELIGAVETAFIELPVDTLSRTFLTLQKVMEESMAVNGGNNYKLPHMHKSKTIDNLASYRLVCKQDSYEGALAAMAARIAKEQELENLVGEPNSQEE